MAHEYFVAGLSAVCAYLAIKEYNAGRHIWCVLLLTAAFL